MQIKIEMDGANVIMSLEGRLVASNADEFKGMIDKLIERKFINILVDLKRLEFIDSSGLGSVIAAGKTLAGRDGKLVCCALNDYVAKVFRITRADQKITITPTRLDGLGIFYNT